MTAAHAPQPEFGRAQVGVIPNDWGVRPLAKELESLEAGVSVNSVADSTGVSADKAYVLKTSSVLDGVFRPREVKLVAPKDIYRLKTSVRADTIIFSRMNTPALVGECGYAARDYENLFLPDRLWMTRFKRDSEISVRWLSYLLNTHSYKLRVKGAATGTSGSMKNISKGALFSLDVPYPKPVEQRAIAAALGDVDALIGALEALIAKKRDIKQAAMQQLLTGRTRLPGFREEWRLVQLGQLGDFSKGRGIRRDQIQREGLPCVRYGEIYTHHRDHVREFYSFISRDVADESQRLKDGDLLFAGSGETAEEIGKCVSFSGAEEVYAGGDIVILSPRDEDSTFLAYLMNYPTITAQKARMGQGDAVVHINARNLAHLSFRRPERPEQAAIATVLSDMDAEIAAVEARRDKTRSIKQGMMQELLTGRIRLQ